MEGLIVLITVALIALWINFMRYQEKYWENAKKELLIEKCPLHKWSYHPVTNRLSCTKCGKTPNLE
jgi:hypothetical protein